MKLRPTTIAGGGIFALSVAVLAMLYTKPELAENDLFSSLAQAIVIQGLIGLAMAFYFTAKSRDHETQKVEIDQPADNPVPVAEADGPV